MSDEITVDDISIQYQKIQEEITTLNSMIAILPEVDIQDDGFGFISEVQCALPILKRGLDEVWPSKYSKKMSKEMMI